ncbi:MAG TPA: GAF domain-containing protein [Ilumatobacter sp.]|nr:GAF domain-containing protein [Ilumatobacter sp.]
MDSPEDRLGTALNELAVALLTESSLTEDLKRLTELACQLVSDCSGGSVSMLIDGSPTTVAVSDRVALQLDLAQYDNGEGPNVTALGGETIRIGYVPSDERFPLFAIGAADRRVLSVLSTPAVERGVTVGSLNLYSRRQDAFGDTDRNIAAIIAVEIANALMRSSLLHTGAHVRERLQREHDEHVLVSRAQGVLVAVQDCSAAQAGTLIQNAAQQNHEAMITTAQRILAAVRNPTQPA